MVQPTIDDIHKFVSQHIQATTVGPLVDFDKATQIAIDTFPTFNPDDITDIVSQVGLSFELEHTPTP